MAKIAITEFRTKSEKFPGTSDCLGSQLFDIPVSDGSTTIQTRQLKPFTKLIRVVPTENCWVHFSNVPNGSILPDFTNSSLVTSFEKQDFLIDNEYRYLVIVSADSETASIPTPTYTYFSYDPITYELDDTLVSERVAVINVPDHEGIYKEIPSTKVAYPGSRIARNIVTSLVTIACTDNGPVADPFGGMNARSYTVAGQYGRFYSGQSISTPGASGISSFWLKNVSGNANLSILGDSSLNYSITPITITDQWTRYASDTYVHNGTNNISAIVQDRNASGWGEFHVYLPALEDVSDRAIKTIPSEGLTLGQTRQFACANGNTVNPTTHVVTEAVGALLDPVPYALSAPAVTNRTLYSNPINWLGTLSLVANIPDIFGEPNKGVTGTGPDLTLVYMRNLSVVNGAQLTAYLWIKKETAAVEYAGIQAAFTGGTNTIGSITLNKNTGTWVPRDGAEVYDSVNVVSDGIFWRVAITITNSGGNTTFTCQVYPGVNNSGSGDWVGFGGSIGIGFGMYVNGPYNARVLPIKTNGAAVARDKDVIAAPLANINQPSNSGYIEVNVTGGTPNILGAFLSFNGVNYRLFDGTTTVSVAGTVGEHKLGWYAGPSGMNLCVDGTWGTEAAYDAELADTLGLFINSAYPQEYRNFRLWNTANKSAIDVRMAS